MVILPHEREEEIIKVLLLCGEVRYGPGMQEFSLVQDRKS
jgi:hypothetical protein